MFLSKKIQCFLENIQFYRIDEKEFTIRMHDTWGTDFKYIIQISWEISDCRMFCGLIKIAVNFVPKGAIDTTLALVWVIL